MNWIDAIEKLLEGKKIYSKKVMAQPYDYWFLDGFTIKQQLGASRKSSLIPNESLIKAYKVIDWKLYKFPKD